MVVLTKIRQMPDNQKKIFSVAASAVVTLIIVVVWSSFGTSSANSQVAGEKVNKLSSVSPVQMIKEEFSKAFSSFNKNMPNEESSSTKIINTVPVEILSATSSPQASTTQATSTASTTKNKLK